MFSSSYMTPVTNDHSLTAIAHIPSVQCPVYSYAHNVV